MTKTVAVSNEVYRKLKELKEASNLSYSELLERLLEGYERGRLEALRRIVERSKLPSDKVEAVRRVVGGLRERSWWARSCIRAR
jgi:predicted CopG family antitoxin